MKFSASLNQSGGVYFKAYNDAGDHVPAESFNVAKSVAKVFAVHSAKIVAELVRIEKLGAAERDAAITAAKAKAQERDAKALIRAKQLIAKAAASNASDKSAEAALGALVG